MKELQMNPVVLFRSALTEIGELEACRKYFQIITQRSHVKKGDLVISRYSALPFYKEFEEDIIYTGGSLINSHLQHCYVANLRNWYYDLAEFTPRTWFYLDQIPEQGPFVLKGQTNSRKHNWKTHMFAENKKQAIEVFANLCADSYIGVQQIYVREYVPLKQYKIDFQGLPISEEYRFFVLNGEVISGGFYWSEHTEWINEELGEDPSPDNVPKDFLDKVINIVSPKIPFFVVDIARTESGEWIVIELNDGQQSGLSDNDPNVLYKNLRKKLKGKL